MTASDSLEAHPHCASIPFLGHLIQLPMKEPPHILHKLAVGVVSPPLWVVQLDGFVLEKHANENPMNIVNVNWHKELFQCQKVSASTPAADLLVGVCSRFPVHGREES